MKAALGILAAAIPLLCGCQSGLRPLSPLEADSPAEARCAAIRNAVPFDQLGTSEDPTTARGSMCGRDVRFARNPIPATSSPLYLPRATLDAATY